MKHYNKKTCDKELLFKGSILTECNTCGAFELTNEFKKILLFNNKKTNES